MLNSKVVEISSDRQRMRARVDPAKWSLTGAEAKSFSSLSVDVPEFVPGKPFLLPTSPVDSLPPAGEFMPGKPFKFATPAIPAADVPLAVVSETITSTGKTGDIGTSAKSENITDATECAAENKPGERLRVLTVFINISQVRELQVLFMSRCSRVCTRQTILTSDITCGLVGKSFKFATLVFYYRYLSL